MAATLKWTGASTAVAQVDTITVGGTVEATDIFILTVTGWDGTSYALSTVAGSTTKSEVATTIAAAWNASTNALLTPITAEGVGDTVVLTADTAGVAFSVAATTTETGGGAADDQTFTLANTTASAGPLHWDTAGNWDGGVVPGAAADHTVYVENASTDILYGLDQSGIANTLAALHIGKSFTGKIGVNGAAGEVGTYLQIVSTIINIGKHIGSGTPSGSGRIMLDAGTVASTINVYGTASSSTDTNKPCVRIKATEATTVCNVSDGKVGIAYESGETSTLATIRVDGGEVYIGDGTTLTTFYKTSGECNLVCGCTTATNESGTLSIYGSGAITTINQIGNGNTYLYGTGTITTLNVTDGVADQSKSIDLRTITTVKVGGDGRFIYDPVFTTLTNQVQPYSATGSKTVRIT